MTILAEEEARLMGHDYVGTEHMVLAMFREGDGIAGQVLKALGFTLTGLREKTAELAGSSDEKPEGHLMYTASSRKVLDLALREALQMGHNYVGTEHLLLGLIREGEGGDGFGVRLLRDRAPDCTATSIRKVVLEHLFGPPPAPPSLMCSEPAPLLRTKGRFCRGDATVEWGPEGDGPDMIVARAPVDAADDLIALVTGARDEIVGMGEAVRLLEKFGFTVTPPAVLDDAQATVDKVQLVDPEE